MFFALIIGFFSGLGQIARNRLLNTISTVYVEVVRGIPLLVQLMYLYYGLGKLLSIGELPAAIAAISICYAAYLSEIFRAGIAAIPKGQMEAALALGFSRKKALFYLIIPQTFRMILPPLGNQFIALLKDSSLVSILAVSDLLRRGREFASVSFKYFETYTLVALIYLIITLFLSKLVALLEDKFSYEE
ncbi:hypothetical protein LSH36_583g02331 [Paralvinella palmiformis]|uniref:ABC transmembrane type-1 domain-containing protein n=1 Tax=Paralvinella palmiformis TaxID=53620 RepID=A0AAD9MXP7_9ANNE|nr:hypothetical protein LSH36_583g02331 [Paralvinella palmiformis]